MKAYLDGMRRYGRFRGRSTRSQYWLFLLGLAVMMLIGAIIDTMLGFPGSDNVMPVTGLIWLAHIVPLISVHARRFHDIDKSAWWLLIAFVPLVGSIVYLIFALTPSTAGANRFGPPTTGDGRMPVSGALNGRIEPQADARAGRVASPPVAELERLASLRASGAIDEAEYQAMKDRLLGSGRI